MDSRLFSSNADCLALLCYASISVCHLLDDIIKLHETLKLELNWSPGFDTATFHFPSNTRLSALYQPCFILLEILSISQGSCMTQQKQQNFKCFPVAVFLLPCLEAFMTNRWSESAMNLQRNNFVVSHVLCWPHGLELAQLCFCCRAMCVRPAHTTAACSTNTCHVITFVSLLLCLWFIYAAKLWLNEKHENHAHPHYRASVGLKQLILE